MPSVEVVTALETVVEGVCQLLTLYHIRTAIASCQAALKYSDTSNLGKKGSFATITGSCPTLCLSLWAAPHPRSEGAVAGV